MACEDDEDCMHACACSNNSSIPPGWRCRRDGEEYNSIPPGWRCRRDGDEYNIPPGWRCRREGDESSNPINLYTTVQRHMQRKLLGYGLEKIYKAQDYMATFCYEDHRGMLTEEAKRQIVQLNKALIHGVNW